MSTSNSINTDFTIQLRDGRNLGVASVGTSGGFPLFHCHGSGSSRLEVLLLADEAIALGVRLIGLDRPGIGRSDAKVGYRFLDWPDDVLEVADRLGIERFAIQGVSAGGPYAMACAYKIPERLRACGLISTVSPSNLIRKAGSVEMRVMWWLGAKFPWFLRFYARLVQRMTGGTDESRVEKYLVKYAARLGTADQRVLDNPELRRLIVKTFVEGSRQGGEASLEAALEGVQPWGFQVEQIGLEKMFLWHGEEDRIMPVGPARLLAQALPHCKATFYADEGHFSVPVHHGQDIFNALRG